MQGDESPSVTSALRGALADAMSRRDRAAMSVLRTALSAIANAEAVPLEAEQRSSAVELSARGVGRTEAPRRSLRRGEQIDIVRREARELRATADSVSASHPDVAARLREDACLLETVLDGVAEDH